MKIVNIMMLAIVMMSAGFCIYGCYKGDPGYGNVDYPEKGKDGGKDGSNR
jgi:hypothetical protein